MTDTGTAPDAVGGTDGPAADALLRTGRFFTRRETSVDLRAVYRRGRSRRRRLLPGPVEPRQGRPFHARGELHGVVLVEGLRQGRDHHLGDAADRLPVGRAGFAGVRAAGLPARCGVLLVHLLAHPGALPVRARRAGGDVPGGEGPPRRSGGGLGGGQHRSGQAPPLPVRARQGRSRAGLLGRGGRDGRRRARAHHPDLRAGPHRGFLPDPGDVDGEPRGRFAVHRAGRRRDDVVLRLVRRPAGGLAAGVRRPDRRAGVRATGGTPPTC